MSEKTKQRSYTTSQIIGLILGVVFFVLINNVVTIDGLSFEGKGILACLALMATWWLTEAVNPGITGLLPLVLFPLSGAMAAGATAAAYGNNTIFMFFGGFAISLALEKWNLHNRIALNIINTVGTSMRKLILGLMLSGGFISMWVSNIATILMLLPIANAIAGEIEFLMKNEPDFNQKNADDFHRAAVFAIGFGAIIGGNHTLIGTPTNLILAGFTPELINYVMPFGNFLLFMTPIAILQYLVLYFMLTRVFYKIRTEKIEEAEIYIKNELAKLGKIKYEELLTLIIFGITAFMWITRTFLFSGVANLTDTIISVIAAITFYIIPAKDGGRLLNADSIPKFPWSVILMLMGGMAISAGFTKTDLAQYLGSLLLSFQGSRLTMIIIVSGLGLLMTQIAPNTATSTILIPITASIATALNIPPLYLMMAAALSSGYATTMPSGTPVMGVIYGTGKYKVSDLVKIGGVLALVSEVLLVIVIYFLVPVFFQV